MGYLAASMRRTRRQEVTSGGRGTHAVEVRMTALRLAGSKDSTVTADPG
jgi:hypothetical protein